MTLDAYLTKAGHGSLSKLARRLGWTPTKLSKIRHGRQEATLREALKIKRATLGRVRAEDLVVGGTRAS